MVSVGTLAPWFVVPQGGVSGGGDVADALEAATRLAETLVRLFGPTGTWVLILVLPAVALLWKWYNNRKEDKEMKTIVAVHEKAVQRAAAEAREYRAAFFIDKLGWTEQRVQKFFVQNQPEDGPAARRQLEKERPKPKKKK